MNAKLTKGLAAAAISAAMMLGAAAPALAVDGTNTLPNDNGYYLTKTYNGVHDGNVTEKIGFSVTPYMVKEAKDGTDISKLPVTISDVDNATSGTDNRAYLTLPNYSSAGYYYYKVTESHGKTAGVKYGDNIYYLKVTVSYEEDEAGNVNYKATKVDSVSLWDTDPTVEGTTAKKVAGFTNTYKPGTLAVVKNIAGNLAQDDETFEIQVTFTSDNPVGSDVSYTDINGEHQTIPARNWKFENGKYTVSASISVRGGSTVKFANLPDGVTYSVKETNSGDGYTPSYKNDKGALEANEKVAFKANETKDDKDDTVTVTNTKDSEVDTGVLLNNAPYIAIIGGAAVVAIYVVNKRRHSDMD